MYRMYTFLKIFRDRAIVESPRDVPYGDINLQECMYSLPLYCPDQGDIVGREYIHSCKFISPYGTSLRIRQYSKRCYAVNVQNAHFFQDFERQSSAKRCYAQNAHFFQDFEFAQGF
jgi:hypothetical protein